MCDTCGCPSGSDNRERKKITVDVNQSLLAANTRQAEENRHHFNATGTLAVNLISSPGSGKTTLLEQTIERLGSELRIGVIEGDIETERDAARIRAKGVPAVQITTGGACHLDARLVHQGIHDLEKEGEGKPFDIVFIENVGNLVCPATFDLGEHERVILLSVPEGSDKPVKYPRSFISAQSFLITKTDLLEHFDFSINEARREALRLNPELRILELSAATGTGLERWLGLLRQLVEARAARHAP